MTPKQAHAAEVFDQPQGQSEGFQTIVRHLQNKVSEADVIRFCANGGRVRASKPKDGIFAYIWRWARFHNGADTTMPCTIDFDLCIQLEKDGAGQILGTGMTVSREESRMVMDWLEIWSDKLILMTGGNPMAGARRWAPLLGFRGVSTM